MTHKQLVYFVEVVRQGGFTRAGAKLNVAQSAVSKHVLQLEHHLRVRLLERGHGGVTLTQPGTRLYLRAQELVTRYDQVVASFRLQREEASGVLRIGVPFLFSDFLLASVLSERPVSMEVGHSAYLQRLVEESAIDCGVLASTDAACVDDIELLQDNLVLIQPHCHGEQSSVHSLNPLDLRERVLALPTLGTPSRDVLDKLFQESEVKPTVVFESSSASSLLKAAAHGNLCTVVPESAVRLKTIGATFSSVRIPGASLHWIFRHRPRMSRYEDEFWTLGLRLRQALLELNSCLDSDRHA